MKSLQVIEKIKQDCKNKGRGRKKWWAENLGVNQVTLSYWLHGQRRPSSLHLERIGSLFSILENEDNTLVWRDYLLEIYFNSQQIDDQILADFIKKILSTETVDSRTLGFLSFLVQNSNIDKFDIGYCLLRNRLGWLLEASGKAPTFNPIRSRTMLFVDISASYSDSSAIAYLKRIQTPLGKRWRVFDCDIEGIRSSF